MDRRVVVTGIGVVASNGVGKEAFGSALRSNKSGVSRITDFDTTSLDSRIAGQASDFCAERFLDKKESRRMERFTQLAVAAAKMAVADAGICFHEEQPERCGVLLGTGMGCFSRMEKECKTLFTAGPSRISPFLLAAGIPNIAAAQVAITFGLQGYLGTAVTACAAGTQAVGEAYFLLQRGIANVMIAGGTEANITPLCLGSFCSMKALSTSNEDPSAACRPFDRERNGFVLAEGAGIVMLETLDHARRRGAPIYAEVVGFGVSSDAYHLTAPEPSARGMKAAMKAALADAKISSDAIDYINAHGTGTSLNDALETLAIKTVFGRQAYEIPVSSTKSMTGHSLSASGAIELIATILAMEQDFIPPTINYHTPDPECDLDYVSNTAREGILQTAMSNSFGFGGQNASIIVRKL